MKSLIRVTPAVLIVIYAAPRAGESNTEFYKMRLLCGTREVEPILPAKVAGVDATIEGIYAYSPKAISADCGTVKLEIVSAGESAEIAKQRSRS